MFREDQETAKYTKGISRTCPMCRANGRVVKDHREETLRIDEDLQEHLRKEHTEEFDDVYTALTRTREFHAKLAFVEFEIGIRRIEEGKTFKW